MDYFGATLLVFFAIAGWCLAVYWHRSCQTQSEDAVKLPWIFSIPFGIARSDRVLNWRGVLLQLSIYIFVPIYIQVPLGLITRAEAFDKLIFPITLVAVIVFLFSLRRK